MAFRARSDRLNGICLVHLESRNGVVQFDAVPEGGTNFKKNTVLQGQPALAYSSVMHMLRTLRLI